MLDFRRLSPGIIAAGRRTSRAVGDVRTDLAFNLQKRQKYKFKKAVNSFIYAVLRGAIFTFYNYFFRPGLGIVDTSHSAYKFRQTNNKYIAKLTKNHSKNYPSLFPLSISKITSKSLFIFRLFNSESPLSYLFLNPHYNHIHFYFLYPNNFSIFSAPNI